MTSKEALNELLTYFRLNGKSAEWFLKCYDRVKKDLEVLDILRNSAKRTSYSIDSGIAPFEVITIDVEETEYAEYRKVDEWLKNE